MIPELKPCPFCGSKEAPTLITTHYEDEKDLYHVLCYWDGGCGATGAAYCSPQGAIDAWNRRVNDETN